jgi:hypothetical protein
LDQHLAVNHNTVVLGHLLENLLTLRVSSFVKKPLGRFWNKKLHADNRKSLDYDCDQEWPTPVLADVGVVNGKEYEIAAFRN